MRGFQTDPVQELRRLLRDTYKADSILKELIQNADDAGAERLHVGWSADWAPELHPLLTGPVLLVLNDGRFTDVDAQAIVRLNIGAKGTDIAAIGKYGLGMKSILHLCEGFFCLASENQPVKVDARAELVTPWAERESHELWSEHRDANEALHSRITQWPHGCTRWFCVAIPLRRPQHEVEGKALFPGEHREVEEVLRAVSPNEIADLLPLLRNLRTVSIWDWQAGEFTARSEIGIVEAGSKHRVTVEIKPGEQRPLDGEVAIRQLNGQSTEGHARFAGIEASLADPRFSELKGRDSWPQNVSLAADATDPEDQPEKAEAHCAAVFTAASPDARESEVRAAVFLPVADQAWSLERWKPDTRLSLTLHGYFFLDAGRHRLVPWESDENGVQGEWNRLLLNEGALPLIPSALQHFVLANRIPEEELRELTAKLSRSELFEKYPYEICRDHQWLFRLSSDDGLTGTWGLVKTGPVLELPLPRGADLSLLRHVFPSLDDLCRTEVITLLGHPRLSRSRAPASWSENGLLGKLLGSIEESALVEAEVLECLSYVLPTLAPLPPESRDLLVAKAQAVAAAHGRKLAQKHATQFRLFVAALPPSRWLGLGPVESAAESTICKLNLLSPSHLILPSTLAPEGHAPEVRLAGPEARLICEWLHETSGERPPQRTSSVALRIVEKTSGTREERRESLGDIDLFATRSARDSKDIRLASWTRLQKLLQERRLFAGSSDFLTALQRSFEDTNLYSLVEPAESEPFLTLFGRDSRPTCNKWECFEKLKEGPVLASPSNRLPLLKLLVRDLQHGASNSEVCALRYLLHANQQAIEDRYLPLLAEQPSSSGTSFATIVKSALKILEEQWRLVPVDLCNQLNPPQRDTLCIAEISGETVSDLLASIRESGLGFSWMAQIPLSARESEEILLAIEDRQLWSAVPLHSALTVGDGPEIDGISLDRERCLLEPKEGAPKLGSLRGRVRILKRPRDHRLLDRYIAAGIQEWSPVVELEALLAQDDVGAHSDGILTALGSVAKTAQELPSELLQSLRARPWLPTRKGPAAE